MADLVSRSTRTSAVDLATQFRYEDAADKADSFMDELELAPSDNWVEGSETGSTPPTFSPTACQWNLLVKRIGVLSPELGDVRKALSHLAEESDNHLEILDDQVTDIRASVGRHPTVLSVNVPGMELWMSLSSLVDTVQGVKHDVKHPVPSQ
jgi:hypothetical protein